MQKYLPSKKFIIRLIIIIATLLVAFGIYNIVIYIKKNLAIKNTPTKILIKDLVQKDTNKNGIPDWEESLWGLDPNTNGDSNKEFILTKRESLAKSTDDSSILPSEQTSKATDQLSKEFFATVMSLQETGNLDDSSISAISEAIGKKIVPDQIPDIYTNDMLTIKPTNSKNILAYQNAIKNLSTKYEGKDIGNELIFISQGLKNKDPQAISVVKDIISSYSLFGQDLIKIPVPESMAQDHLSLANNYEKVSESIVDLMQVLSDQLVGMKGLINYKKYSDGIVNDYQNISDKI